MLCSFFPLKKKEGKDSPFELLDCCGETLRNVDSKELANDARYDRPNANLRTFFGSKKSNANLRQPGYFSKYKLKT